MEIFRALGALIEPSDTANSEDRLRIARLLELAELADDLPPADAYTEVFLFQLYPYASVYLGAEGMMGGEARDRIAGFLRALGATPPAEPDHLAYLLAAYSDLATQGDESADRKLRRARKAFLCEHLLSWIPGWLHALRCLNPPDFYRRWADLLDASLHREAAALTGPHDELPLHLRESTDLADPADEGASAFIQSLLAPARSGIIIVRDDLRRAAEDLGLGMRAGERRYVVEHLLGQDAGAILGWLAGEADRWAEFWSEQLWLGEVGRWWGERAAKTARVVLDYTKSEVPAAP